MIEASKELFSQYVSEIQCPEKSFEESKQPLITDNQYSHLV